MDYHKKIRNPDGVLEETKKSLKKWDKLAEPLEKLGFIRHSCDPGIVFSYPDSNNLITFPVCALRKINKAIELAKKSA